MGNGENLMDLTNSVRCSRCSMEMRETIMQDIPTCRVSNYYCEKCSIMVSIYSIAESRLEQLQEVHPMEDK